MKCWYFSLLAVLTCWVIDSETLQFGLSLMWAGKPSGADTTYCFLFEVMPVCHERRDSSPYFFILKIFIFTLFYFTVLVLPYIDMNPPRVYTSSQSWNPLPLSTPYHLSGSSPCTSPKHPVSCIEHRLALHFLHDSIHFQCHSPKSSHLSLSLRVQKSILYICVSFAVSHPGSSLPSF